MYYNWPWQKTDCYIPPSRQHQGKDNELTTPRSHVVYILYTLEGKLCVWCATPASPVCCQRGPPQIASLLEPRAGHLLPGSLSANPPRHSLSLADSSGLLLGALAGDFIFTTTEFTSHSLLLYHNLYYSYHHYMSCCYHNHYTLKHYIATML